MSTAFAYERDTKGGTNTWLTPRWILDQLGAFNLDPCAHPGWPTAAQHYCWPEQDGLMLPWHGRVWCNPPYGNQAQAWAEKMAVSDNGIMLLFARTETRMFQRLWDTAKAMLFLYGRVAFHRADGSASECGNAPSVLIAFGDENARILRGSNLGGAFVDHWEVKHGRRAHD